jgi:uncharacterized protein YcbX
MLHVSQLYIYPIKSLGGIALDEAYVTDRGFEYDRRWMLVDQNNNFMTQRKFENMSLLKVAIVDSNLIVTYIPEKELITIPITSLKNELATVQVWEDSCTGQFVSDEADEWFSAVLQTNCRLVFMPNETRRTTDPEYTPGTSLTSFSDGYPFLMIGQSSLIDLNTRLAEKIPMNRFRPNIVFAGGQPYEEDTIGVFTIGDITFCGVKLCGRCVITTVDQMTGKKNKEPLVTLSTYRAKNHKVCFGQNLIHEGQGMIKIGDEIKVLKRNYESRFVI